MKEFFAEYGTITDIVRMKDKETGSFFGNKTDRPTKKLTDIRVYREVTFQIM